MNDLDHLLSTLDSLLIEAAEIHGRLDGVESLLAEIKKAHEELPIPPTPAP